jgi:acetyl-CoA carboxylase carboxyl transferase subunit alpha
MSTYLDFEEPLKALEEQIAQTKELGESTNVDMSEQLAELEQVLQEKTKEVFSGLTPWQRVQLSRHPDRPYTLAYIDAITNGQFIELHGDRSVKFNKPIVTFIDTPGAFPGLEAEERGQGEAIARNIYEMMRLKVPVICIIIGEGASGGALGIGVGDKVVMLENTWYSVISPESCSSILWRSWNYKEIAADALKLTSTDMRKNGLVDEVIPEPSNGAHRNPEEMFSAVKVKIKNYLSELEKMNPEKRVEDRIEKFCQMGVWK